MSEKQQLGFAAAAFVAGLAWGALRHRQSERSTLLSLLQGLEWFVAYGGAVAAISWLREALEEAEAPEAEDERVTHFRQVVTERTGTEG
jgi:hypothetical protein